MRTRILVLIIVFSFLLTPVKGETNGYFSIGYAKGQKQADVSMGSFLNPQLGLIFSGDVTAKIDYVSEIRFKREDSIELEQALVRFKSSDAFNLSLGLFLVPFGRYNQSNRPHQTQLINFPLNVEKMFPSSWRDMGLLVEGEFSGFFYSAYLGNGLGEAENLIGAQQFRDNNTDKGKGGRVGITLSRGFDVAYSYYRGKYDDDEENTRDLVLQGVDIIWQNQDFQILSEYSKAYLENPDGSDTGKTEGYFIQLSLKGSRLQPVASYQRIKYQDPFLGEGISEERSRWTVGLVLAASENLFLSFEYDFNSEKETKLKDNSFSAQVVLSF
jgi:hypothetical protein